MVVAVQAFATVDGLIHRFLNPTALLTWFIRGAITWVVSLPLALRAIQAMQHLERAAPPALVALFFALLIGKMLLLVLLGRALDRVQGKPGVLSSYKAASH